MNTNDINQLIKVIAGQGIWFFLLYIVYHYTSQIIAAFVGVNLIRFIVKTIDNWVQVYFWKNSINPNYPYYKGQILQVSKDYQDKEIAGKLVKVDNFFDIEHYLKDGAMPVKIVGNKSPEIWDIPTIYLESLSGKQSKSTL